MAPIAVVILCNSARAQSSLVLSNGVVVKIGGGTELSPSFLVLENPSSSAIQSSGNSHLNSEGQHNIIRWKISSQTGNYQVPFGTLDSPNLPLGMTINQAGSPNGYIDFASYGTGTNNLPLPSGVASIDHIDIPNDGIGPPPSDGSKVYDRFWFIDASSYSTKPGGTMSVTYSPAEQTGDLQSGLTSMAVQFHNGTQWIVNQFGVDDMSGTISGVPFSNGAFYSTFTLVQSGAALPITLINFNAVWHDDEKTKARIFWSTASELNNDFFVIERSRDGINWHSIERVAGAGTSINTNHYQIFDANPLSGVSYYRLKQTDFDGQKTYSQVVSLKREEYLPSIAVYPNPSNSNLYVSMYRFPHDDVINIQVLDLSGKVVFESHLNKQDIIQETIQLNLEKLDSGSYQITCTSNNFTALKRFIISK